LEGPNKKVEQTANEFEACFERFDWNNIMDASKIKMAYVINERGGKSYFNRVGIAFVNSDGSLNVKLEAMPINGELHIRDYVPREESAGPGVTRTKGNGNTRTATAAAEQ
jgi:hypothetical protein